MGAAINSPGTLHNSHGPGSYFGSLRNFVGFTGINEEESNSNTCGPIPVVSKFVGPRSKCVPEGSQRGKVTDLSPVRNVKRFYPTTLILTHSKPILYAVWGRTYAKLQFTPSLKLSNKALPSDHLQPGPTTQSPDVCSVKGGDCIASQAVQET
ncbi:hypothetical protein BY996DRAFT_6415308 [Phakopsora pachyrhizi]|nr:hypothetical protein BY996DRAFT_6415308 [Phakopsora pachyrhizi]